MSLPAAGIYACMLATSVINNFSRGRPSMTAGTYRIHHAVPCRVNLRRILYIIIYYLFFSKAFDRSNMLEN